MRRSRLSSTWRTSQNMNQPRSMSLIGSSIESFNSFCCRNIKEDTIVVQRFEPPSRPVPPPGVEDFDLENWNDPSQCSEYAMDIFYYYKQREVLSLRLSRFGPDPLFTRPSFAFRITSEVPRLKSRNQCVPSWSIGWWRFRKVSS